MQQEFGTSEFLEISNTINQKILVIKFKNILYKLSKPQLKLNYFLTFLLIAYSGITFFFGDRYLLVGFLIVAAIFIIKKIKLDKFILIFVGIFILLFGLQIIDTKIFPFTTQIGFIIRILTAYFIIKIIGKDFLKYYVNAIIIFSLISFVFYIPILISPSFEQILINKVAPNFAYHDRSQEIYSASPHFIIFTINTDTHNHLIARNSGPFWEGGAFAGFLMVALIFNFILSKSLFRNIKSIILAIALLTTLSTSGYLAFGILIIFYVLIYTKYLLTKIVWVISILMLFYISFTQLDFLGEKIEEDVNILFSAPLDNLPRNRFVSAMLDIIALGENPILGTGVAEPDYSFALMKKYNHRNNGVTSLARKFGIFVFILYFFSMYRSFLTLCYMNNVKTSFSIFIMMVIFTIGFSENFFYKSFFISLIFLNFIYFESFPPLRIIELNKLKFIDKYQKDVLKQC
jgi:hypothetical protein